MAAFAVVVLAASCTSSADAGQGDVGRADINIITTVLDPVDPVDRLDPLQLPVVEISDSTTSSTSSTTTTSTTTTSTTEQPSDTTVAPNTTVAPTTSLPVTSTTAISGIPPWQIGLLNTESSVSGSFQAFRHGVEAAVGWWNDSAAATGGRGIALVSCAGTDAVSTVACAEELVSSSDAIIHGIDLFSELSIPIIEQGSVPVLGGMAVRSVDAFAANAGLDVGGPPAAHAALAQRVIDEGHSNVVVFHDDTDIGFEMIDVFVRPILEAAGVVVTLLPVPVATSDSTGVVAPLAPNVADSWIVATSESSCGSIATSRAQLGLTIKIVWSTSCATDGVFDNFGELMAGDEIAFELVEPRLFDYVSSDLRAGYELANQVLLQHETSPADDPLALRGWLVGTRLVQTLERGTTDLVASRDVRGPNPLGAGEIACGANATAVCSGDVMFFGWDGETIRPPMSLANGLGSIEEVS
ncbi:MAG: ABC transporter substrate-binding protein [Actinomycetia bacterium]|nr:ABC transporter substrate-binding protein [Actinomycetes bacterium]